MPTFDYDAPVELFGTQTQGTRKLPVTYRRFANSASAVQFVIEELPADAQKTVTLEVAETRFDPVQIRELYDSPGYPLKRKAK
jgi:hypothetical protein